ncbi:hypothetical protein ONS96_013096 [Cadophora gregata f. sp. sojae]|nr:hypothetical protein ONS96_013096 [Cadophora gregata f. sp. sojae]
MKLVSEPPTAPPTQRTESGSRRDTDLNTGNTLVNRKWRTATRGEKLRTCAHHRQMYEKEKMRCERDIGMGLPVMEDGRVSDVNKEKIRKYIDVRKRRVGYLEQHFELLDAMEKLVL